MMTAPPENIHATAVSIGGHGVLLIGKTGSGKSDLALRLIDRGAVLISDDRVIVANIAGEPILQAVPNIGGMIEIRGIAIAQMQFTTDVPLRLIVNLDEAVPRFCEAFAHFQVAGFAIPKYALAAFEASAPVKLEYALQAVVDQTTAAMPKSVLQPEN